jgi:hypothetical protein
MRLKVLLFTLALSLFIISAASAGTCYNAYEQDIDGAITTYGSASYVSQFIIKNFEERQPVLISGYYLHSDGYYPTVGGSEVSPEDYHYNVSFWQSSTKTGYNFGNGTIDLWWIDEESTIGYQFTITDWNTYGLTGERSVYIFPETGYWMTGSNKYLSTPPSNNVVARLYSNNYPRMTVNYYYTCDALTPTPTPTPLPDSISVNLIEKYSNAALVNQAITITPTAGGAGETKTSLYGETLHFGVVPGMEYWFNASRAGYHDYNETYTIPASPGIYTVYMERILPPIADHSYAHFSVVDQTNGGLIPNAEIRLSDGQTKLTNSAGYAWFSVNNSEQINYYVSKPSGYWPAYGAMNLTADESILVALQRYTGPTATATMPGWTPVTVPTTGTGVDPVVTLSAQLRQQNVQEGMDVWYTNLPFISQFLFLLFIIGGLGLMAGGTRRN